MYLTKKLIYPNDFEFSKTVIKFLTILFSNLIQITYTVIAVIKKTVYLILKICLWEILNRPEVLCGFAVSLKYSVYAQILAMD